LVGPRRSQSEGGPTGESGYRPQHSDDDSSGQTWFGHPAWASCDGIHPGRRLVQEVGLGGASSGIHGVFRIREDATGRIWAATTLGLYVRERSGLWRLFTEKEGILPLGLFGMAFLPDGTAWIFSRSPRA